MKIFTGCLNFILWLLLALPGFAADKDSDFDPIFANQTLDRLSIQLSIQNLDVNKLQDAITALLHLQDKAEECITQADASLALINEQLAAIVPGAEQNKNIIENKKNLENQKIDLSQRLSNCRIFLLRSKEATSAFRETAQGLVATELVSRSPTLLENIKQASLLSGDVLGQIDWLAFYDRTGLIYWNQWLNGLYLLVLLMAISIGILMRRFLQYQMRSAAQKEKEASFSKASLKVLHAYCLPGCIFLLTLFYFQTVSYFYIPVPYFMFFALSLVFYWLYLLMISLLLIPPKPVLPIENLSEKQLKHLANQLKILGFLFFGGFVLPYIFQPEHIPVSILSICRMAFMVALTINFACIIFLISHAMGWMIKGKTSRVIVYSFIYAAAFTIILAELAGYSHFSDYFLRGMIITLLFLFLTIKLHIGIDWLFEQLEGNQQEWNIKLRSRLGIGKYNFIFEFTVLRIVTLLIFWSCFVMALFNVWKLNDLFALMQSGFWDGFKIADVLIIPSRILSGLLLFVFLYLLLRYIRTGYIKNPIGKTDRSSREELATISSYVAIGLALIFCLIVSGVNFTGLAIVTGALSVGIGFGLQTIVNNFVSGIIMLIERPVKKGDRIIVGNTEGYVKKISIRSTRIQTPQRSDVIVPNAELITSQVTNFMLTDNYGRIEIPVGVAYGTDPDKVKEILLKVAYAHPEIITEEEPRKPIVLLKRFSDSALDFELLCIIKDVNLKAIVVSDLNFAILKAFTEQEIQMPFPQRDLHIKDWPEKGEQVSHESDTQRKTKKEK